MLEDAGAAAAGGLGNRSVAQNECTVRETRRERGIKGFLGETPHWHEFPFPCSVALQKNLIQGQVPAGTVFSFYYWSYLNVTGTLCMVGASAALLIK